MRVTPQPPQGPDLDPAALQRLGAALRGLGYRFITPTPATIATVRMRPVAVGQASLRDVFGWSRAFTRAALPDAIRALAEAANALVATGDADGSVRSRVRFSTLGDWLLVHSAYPTDQGDAVFFGPDTYRFADFIGRGLQGWQPRVGRVRVLDLGCGTGAGGLVAQACAGPNVDLFLADINPAALRMAQANLGLAGVAGATAQGDLYAAVKGPFDVVVANPPYLCDDGERAYRHGAGVLGTGLAERIVAEGMDRLSPGGRLLLYSGAPIVDGTDALLARLQAVLATRGDATLQYREIDPDVFGEELARPAYRTVERIAAVGAVVQKAGPPAGL